MDSALVSAFHQVVIAILDIYTFILIAHALLSWVNPDPYNPIVQWLRRLTEPVLEPIRKTIPPLGGFDFSVLIVLLVIYFLRSVLLY